MDIKTETIELSFDYWFKYYQNLKMYCENNHETFTKIEHEKFRTELLFIADKLLTHIDLTKKWSNHDNDVVLGKRIMMIDMDRTVHN